MQEWNNYGMSYEGKSRSVLSINVVYIMGLWCQAIELNMNSEYRNAFGAETPLLEEGFVLENLSFSC